MRRPFVAPAKADAVPFRAANLSTSTSINKAALAAFPAVLARLLPGGKACRRGIRRAQSAPRRSSSRIASRSTATTARWADFATGDKGGDPISLVAYLADVSQGEAARLLARMLGLEVERRRDG